MKKYDKQKVGVKFIVKEEIAHKLEGLKNRASNYLLRALLVIEF